MMDTRAGLERTDAAVSPEAGEEVARLRQRVADLEEALAGSLREAGRVADARLQAILESSPAGIAMWDAADRLTAFNRTYGDMFFGGREHLIRLGDSFAEHSRRFVESGVRATVAGVTEAFHLERARRRRNPQETFEQRIGDRWILSRESRTSEGGMISVHLDVTPLKHVEQALHESEHRFRVLADTMPALLWMDDAEGSCVFVNKTWLDYTGRDMEDELGLGWTRSLHPDDVASVMRIETEARQARRLYTETYRLRRADGEYRWFLDTGAPRFADGDGRFLGYVGTLLDITDRRRLEAELNQKQKMEAIGQLTGGVAHDFNNLLTVISGNLELAIGRVEDPRTLDMLRLGYDAAERGAALIQRLLAFGRRQALSPQAVELDRLVEEFSALLRRTLGTPVEVETVLPRGLWPALVDPGQLENVLLNLAINARDAMPQGGTLTIAVANRDVAKGEVADLKPGRYVTISVTDTGDGMPPDVLERAVQPFFTTKNPGKGSGLGLSMAYGFAMQSGGHLHVESEVGRGTTVRILLPVSAGPAVRRNAAEEDGAMDLLAGSVLVVDDEPEVLNVAVAMLESLGYRVTTAADGPSAMRWLDEGTPFDLLLTDVMLPGGMNGAQLAQRAAAARPEMRILLMSGYTEDALAEKGIGAALLHKPFRKRELVAKIREASAG